MSALPGVPTLTCDPPAEPTPAASHPARDANSTSIQILLLKPTRLTQITQISPSMPACIFIFMWIMCKPSKAKPMSNQKCRCESSSFPTSLRSPSRLPCLFLNTGTLQSEFSTLRTHAVFKGSGRLFNLKKAPLKTETLERKSTQEILIQKRWDPCVFL